jgi:trehalose-6-phosphate synthase
MAAGQINSRYGEFDWTPLRYINKSFSHQILAGFFRASRIALVTSLRDGMNLVAKEYVASQPADDPGVLILSCFAGAARELGEAVIANPLDVEGVAEAILRGLNMPVGERKERWVAMMKVFERNDITAWRERFVRALSAIDTQRQGLRRTSARPIGDRHAALRAAADHSASAAPATQVTAKAPSTSPTGRGADLADEQGSAR